MNNKAKMNNACLVLNEMWAEFVATFVNELE